VKSASLTAGVAALVIQAYRNTHGGATPSPAVVKRIITSTAEDVGAPAEQQGTGLVDAYKAGEAFYYQVNVPAGRPELNATITLVDNPNNVFDAWLISPSGEARAFAENTVPISNPATNELGTQLHVLSPQAGTWTLDVLFSPQVSGMALSEPFTVTMNQNAVPVQSSVPPGEPSRPAEHPVRGSTPRGRVRYC
jgi:hypothetical protein